MKKILIVAALVAATALPVTVVSAADAPAAATPKLTTSCFFLPLLPDCLAAWKAEGEAVLHKAAPAPKTVAAVTPKLPTVAAPKLPAIPTCTKAAAGAGHLYDCK